MLELRKDVKQDNVNMLKNLMEKVELLSQREEYQQINKSCYKWKGCNRKV